jgi:DNA-binding response OmpR family regulator
MHTRILLVENDIVHLRLLSANLSANGYIVDEFTDPFKASLVFEKNPDKYNILIIDMESISARELRKIKNMNKNIKILAITASEINFNGMELDAVLKKPIQVDLLMHMVRKLVMPTVTLWNTYCF